MNAAAWTDVGGMDDLGRIDSPMHRVDPRAKALVTLAFLVLVMSYPPHELSSLAPWALFPVVMLAAGRIPFRPIGRKMLAALPFALAVGVFNPLLDRDPGVVVGSWTISEGWLSFLSILGRFMLTVSAALALVAVTGIYRLTAGLERLGVPKVFATQLLFLYRYLFVLADDAGTMVRSVQLRAPGYAALPAGVYASLVGHLLLRSLDRADRIHRAMVARGFDGVVRSTHAMRFGMRDAGFIAGWLAFFAVIRLWDVPGWLGAALQGVAR